MKVFEILNFNREPLKRLQQAGIRIEDVEYIDLYNDYRVMLGGGEKVSYIVATLADRYHVSERTKESHLFISHQISRLSLSVVIG